jgi:hypothetical protein
MRMTLILRAAWVSFSVISMTLNGWKNNPPMTD